MEKWVIYSSIVALIIILFIYMIWMPGNSYQGILPELTSKEKKISRNTQVIINKLAGEIGARHIHAPDNLNKAVEYLILKLEEIGYVVNKQQLKVDNVICYNLETEILGTEKPEEILVIGAHYDSVEYDNSPGANDNASGVAGVLELARILKDNQLKRTVKFVLFVNEEPPYFQTHNMGSLHYAKKLKGNKANVVAMINLETIGYYSDEENSQHYPIPFNLFYPGKGNFIGFVGNISSGSLVRKAIKIFRNNTKFSSEGGAFWSKIPGVDWSDHWSFWKQGYKAIMLTDTALYRYPYYHSAIDTPDKIDYDRLARVIAGIEKIILVLANEN